CVLKWSVKSLIRAVKSAICTSGDPVSLSARPNDPMISCFFSFVIAIARPKTAGFVVKAVVSNVLRLKFHKIGDEALNCNPPACERARTRAPSGLLNDSPPAPLRHDTPAGAQSRLAKGGKFGRAPQDPRAPRAPIGPPVREPVRIDRERLAAQPISP